MDQLEIVSKTKLTDEDKSSLFGWSSDLWNNDRYALTWRRPDLKFIGYVADRAITHASAVLHTIQVDEREVRLGGLAGVITHPMLAARAMAVRLSARWRIICGTR
jgi:hypothetical protein